MCSKVYRRQTDGEKSRASTCVDYCRMFDVSTFESDLQRWGNQGYSAGVREREKPEDGGYLLLLAAPRTKTRLNTSSV